MGKNNTDLLKIAQSHLGEGGAKFRRFCGLPAGAAWCNAFVDYVYAEGHDASLIFDGKRPTYCPASIEWCRKNLAQIPIYLALPCDIIYFDWEPNGIPNHIGLVRERKSDQEIYTIEGNTSGGIVANKTRTVKYVEAVFRPHFKAEWTDAKLVIDGYFGYNSIAMLQKALGVKKDGILGKGTVKALQKRAGVAQDGSWGVKTSKAVQKMVGTKVDGDFGPKSVKALQEWVNKQNEQTWRETTIAKAKKLTGDPKAGYRKWNGKDKSTQECLTCHPETDPHHKWYRLTFNCIGWYAYLMHHLAGFKQFHCSQHFITDEQATALLKMPEDEAIKKWEKYTGLKGWLRYRDADGIPESKLRPCDAILFYNGGKYYHIGAYAGDGKIIDCGNWKNKDKQLAVRPYDSKDVKLAFSYTGGDFK